MSDANPRVFVSYSHDSEEHRDRVLALADRLRRDGVDAFIDQYEPHPPEGWPARCEIELAKADFVLLVCTEIYLRRWNGDESPGIGRGVRWEVRWIRQHLYDSGSATAKLVPVLFADGADAHVPTMVRGASIHRVETDAGYDALYGILTAQHDTPAPPLGARRPLPLRTRARANGSTRAAPADLRAGDLFVGRRPQLDRLAELIFPRAGTRRPMVISGMPGVGKSYLADRFYWERRDRFPGEYLRLSLDPNNPTPAANLLADIADRLKVSGGDPAALAARLQAPATLLHIENADTPEVGRVVGEAVGQLPGCAVIVSARLRGLGAAAGWGQVELAPFDEAAALDQLAAELSEVQDRASWPSLAQALGYLPLALHLAAGHLRAGHRPDAFLRRLRQRKLALESADPADPVFRERSRTLLSDTFELSLSALEKAGSADGKAWRAGLAALGHAPASGVGESLGAAIAGMSADAFLDMVDEAVRFSVLERFARGSDAAYRLHPLLAEFVRPDDDAQVALQRITEWFIARLPEGSEDDRGRRWNAMNDELAALTEWLTVIPPGDQLRVVGTDNRFAMVNGPFHAWARFYDGFVAGDIGDAERSRALLALSYVALRAGLTDRSRDAAEKKRDLDNRRGREQDAASATSLIADITDECGDPYEALRLYREEVLPVYERFGAAYAGARAKGRIVDILTKRDDFDEALRICREEVLPVYEQLRDSRGVAVTKGQIANIMQRRGDLDGALRLRREEVLPVYERLGDMRGAGLAKWWIANMLMQRGQAEDRAEAEITFHAALDILRRLGVAEVSQLEQQMRQLGFDPG